jgi:hypothetical protein
MLLSRICGRFSSSRIELSICMMGDIPIPVRGVESLPCAATFRADAILAGVGQVPSTRPGLSTGPLVARLLRTTANGMSERRQSSLRHPAMRAPTNELAYIT